MITALLSLLLTTLSFTTICSVPTEKADKTEESSFFEDVAKKLGPRFIPDPTARTAANFAEKLNRNIRENNIHSNSPWRDFVVEAAIEVEVSKELGKVAPFLQIPLLVSSIGNIASKHFEQNRAPATERDRLIAFLAYGFGEVPGIHIQTWSN